jgi:hypothetical protein
MPHAVFTAAAPTDRAALRAPPPTAAKPRGTPWWAAIAAARTTHRVARIATRSTQRAARAPAADGQTYAAHTSPSSSPPAPRLVPIAPYTGDSLLQRELAAGVAGPCAPAIRPSQGAPRPSPVAPFKPSRIDPLNREPTAEFATVPFKPFRIDPLNRERMAKPGSTVPFKPSRIDALNREPTGKPGSTAPFKPFSTDPLNREPAAKTGPTAPRVTGSNASSTAATAQPARAHDPAPHPGQSGEASKVRPAPAEAGGAAPTLLPPIAPNLRLGGVD